MLDLLWRQPAHLDYHAMPRQDVTDRPAATAAPSGPLSHELANLVVDRQFIQLRPSRPWPGRQPYDTAHHITIRIVISTARDVPKRHQMSHNKRLLSVS